MDYLGVLSEHILPLVFAFLIAVVVPLIRAALKGVEKKFDIDIDDRLEARALELVQSGIRYAEEWAVKKTKAGESKPSGAEKLDEALDFIKKEAERAGLSTWVESRGDDLSKVIEGQIRKVI